MVRFQMNTPHTWDSARRPDTYEKFLLDKVTMYRPMLQVHRQPRFHWKVELDMTYDKVWYNAEIIAYLCVDSKQIRSIL